MLKTGAGPYTLLSGTIVGYRADSSGGNSGSPVFLDSTGRAIAIHTSGSCSSTSGYNAGTALQSAGLQAALASPKGVCRSGKAPVVAPLYAIGDLANNFGTIERSNGYWGRIGPALNGARAMALRLQDGLMYAVDASQRLNRLSPSTGAAAGLPVPIIASSPVTAMTHDPFADVLFGVCGATGQLVTLDRVTGLATKIGSPAGGNIAAITFITSTATIVGIDNAPAGPRLVSISRTTGKQTVIGPLGAGVPSWTSLAFCDDDHQLYALDGAGSTLYDLDPLTGAATGIGPTGGVWAPTAAMAYLRTKAPCSGDCNIDGVTNTFDLVEVLATFGRSVTPGLDGDVTGDGQVNVVDLSIVTRYLGCR